MELPELMRAVNARLLTRSSEASVCGCYISDLLSDVLAHSDPGVLWVTIQTHRNVVSVAATNDIPVVLITCNRQPDPATIAEAEENGVTLLSTPLSTYETAATLWQAGLTPNKMP